MIILWCLVFLTVAYCNQDIDMSQHVNDFLNDLSQKDDSNNNHNHHDHSNHNKEDHNAHAGHMMMMWFHGGYNEVILFDFWRINSLQGLIVSCVIIFIMGAAYEGLKWFRVFLQVLNSKNDEAVEIPIAVTEKSGACQNGSGANEPLVISRTVARGAVKHSAFSIPRLIQGFLYIVQLILAYWLMLIVMTYNTWLSIAVILGAGFGHWLFAVLQLENVHGQAADSFATDACH